MQRRIAILFVVMSLSQVSLANSASTDDAYRQAVAKAIANPAGADYASIRNLYSQSSYYREYESDPINFQLLALQGKAPSDKDVHSALDRDFALPGVHLFALQHFKSRISKRESGLRSLYAIKLITAILKTGKGTDEARAIKVLVVSEEYLVMEFLKLKRGNQRLVTSKDGTKRFDVFGVTLPSGKKADMWFDISALSRN